MARNALLSRQRFRRGRTDPHRRTREHPPLIWALGGLERLISRARRERCIHSARMSAGVAIALGAALGLLLGIVVSLATELPLAPEAGLVLGALLGWMWLRRHGA